MKAEMRKIYNDPEWNLRMITIIDEEGNTLEFHEGYDYRDKNNIVQGDWTFVKKYAKIDGADFRRLEEYSKSADKTYARFIKSKRGLPKQSMLDKLQKMIDFAVEQFEANQFENAASIECKIF